MLSVLTSVLISSVLSLQLGSDGCEIGICFDVSCFSILFYFPASFVLSGKKKKRTQPITSSCSLGFRFFVFEGILIGVLILAESRNWNFLLLRIC